MENTCPLCAPPSFPHLCHFFICSFTFHLIASKQKIKQSNSRFPLVRQLNTTTRIPSIYFIIFTWQLYHHSYWTCTISFSCIHWIPKVNGKTIDPINIINKISKGILVVVFSRCIKGTCHNKSLYCSGYAQAHEIKWPASANLRTRQTRKESFFCLVFLLVFVLLRYVRKF